MHGDITYSEQSIRCSFNKVVYEENNGPSVGTVRSQTKATELVTYEENNCSNISNKTVYIENKWNHSGRHE
jgi:hypothetical protein